MILASLSLFFLAFVASLILTGLARLAAPRIGLIDRPDGFHKLHPRPTPLGGGLAVFLATAGVMGALLAVPNPWGLERYRDWPAVLALLLAGAVIVPLGLVDDRVRLRGQHKLLGQLLAASILVGGGISIDRVEVFGWTIEFGPFAVLFTLFWLVGAINAVNLLDGIDGLAAVVGIILSGTVGVMAAITGHPEVAILALVFTGSLLGFLCFNLPPASIFLGDAGSMLIGLVVGTMAIRGSLKGPGTVLLAAPLALWTIPILDSLAAVLRRKLTGRSIYARDRGHIHHRLLAKLGSGRKTLAAIAACCAFTSAAALCSVFLKNDLIALLSSLAIVFILLATGIFGRNEFLLVSDSLCGAARSLTRLLSMPIRAGRTEAGPQGGQWDVLWAGLVESVDEFGLQGISLDLVGRTEEHGYSVTWQRPSPDDLQRCWRMELPLVIRDEPVGRLTLIGNRNGTTAYQDIERVQNLVEAFEARLAALWPQLRPPGCNREASAVAAGVGLPVCQADQGDSTRVVVRKQPK